MLLTLTAAVSAGCAVIAAGLSQVLGIPFSDAYLATTPGGINAVMDTAVATAADVALISSVQSLRLFVMALIGPLLVRFAPGRSLSGGSPAPART